MMMNFPKLMTQDEINQGEIMKTEEALMMASDTQVGGTHYKEMQIQPMTFCMANKFDYATSNVIKYVTRKKGDKVKRKEDLNKAIHCIQLLAEHEGITL